MTTSRKLMIAVSLAFIFAAAPLSAMAEQQTNKKPATKAQAVQPKGATGVGRPEVSGRPPGGPGQHGVAGMGHAAGRPSGRAAGSGPHFAHDRSHWGDRERRAWAGGHWRPYECRFGRCGYWWMADGYWYFYDNPMDGPPDVVSDVEYADPNADAALPPDVVPAVVPAPVVIQRPPVCVGPICL
jgi:hypothetical protein